MHWWTNVGEVLDHSLNEELWQTQHHNQPWSQCIKPNLHSIACQKCNNQKWQSLEAETCMSSHWILTSTDVELECCMLACPWCKNTICCFEAVIQNSQLFFGGSHSILMNTRQDSTDVDLECCVLPSTDTRTHCAASLQFIKVPTDSQICFWFGTSVLDALVFKWWWSSWPLS